MPEAMLIILASENGRDEWFPVKPSDVPDWVKVPENLGRLVAGEMCMKCDEGEAGSKWYRAERVLSTTDTERIEAAQAKRERRMARNRTVVH